MGQHPEKKILARLRRFMAVSTKETVLPIPSVNEQPGPSMVSTFDCPRQAVTYGKRPADVILCIEAPFEWDGVMVRTVELREPTFGDVEAVLRGDISQIDLFERMSGLPAAAWKAMRWSDSERCVKAALRLAPELRKA